MEEELFSDFATGYLSLQVHADTRNHFLGLLRANGFHEAAARIEKGVCEKTSKALTVFAVDDSKMILSIYRSVLHKLGCDPVLFEFPAQAMDQVGVQKPDFVFTDLNMPDINGVELTRAIRRKYDKERLPIVMVTTQNECQDNEAAYAAGVNDILQKPFNEETLRTAIEKHLTNKLKN